MQKPGLFGMNGFMVFLLCCFAFAAHAQQPGYLILIDAENKQSFTMRIGDQFYTSSGHGHLVLAQLKDSSYRLNLRFPKKNTEEQVFPVVIHHKDLGFQLKEANGSWSLYNWQTKETIHPVSVHDSSRVLDMGVKREDGFSQLMASVVNDSSVMYNTYTGNGFNKDSVKTSTDSTTIAKAIKGQRPSPDVQRPIANRKDSLVNANRYRPSKDSLISGRRQQPSVNMKDSLATAKLQKLSKDSLITASLKQPTANMKDSLATAKLQKLSKDSLITHGRQQPMAKAQRPKNFKTEVKKLREVSLKISRKIVYLDIGEDGLADTVTLYVFFENADTGLKKQQVEPVLAIKKLSRPDSAGLGTVQAKSKPGLKTGETACSQLATENDVQSLRDAILKANTDQDKISVASGAFSLKCFSVSQIRLLAGLLVSDKSKYRLMDAAHLHIADYDHFRELVDMLTDKNFQRKFLAMAEKRS